MTMTLNPASTDATSARSALEPAWFTQLQRGSLVASTVTVGLAAGFFFTYQVSVIRGLGIVDDRTYIESFQAINATIRNAWFGAIFFGTIPMLSATLALQWRKGGPRRVLVGSSLVLYLATLAITAVGSVPLNDELALVTERTPDVLAAARADFEGPWNTLNLARTFTSAGALVAIALAGRVRRTGGE